MDHTSVVTLTLGLGVITAMLYQRRTGWSTGGLITPGLLAASAHSIRGIAFVLLLSLLLAGLLRLLVRRFTLFGRERVGVALLLAVACRLIFKEMVELDVAWIGWIVPGLIAADIERQGTVNTFAAVVSSSLATLFLMNLLSGMVGLR